MIRYWTYPRWVLQRMRWFSADKVNQSELLQAVHCVLHCSQSAPAMKRQRVQGVNLPSPYRRPWLAAVTMENQMWWKTYCLGGFITVAVSQQRLFVSRHLGGSRATCLFAPPPWQPDVYISKTSATFPILFLTPEPTAVESICNYRPLRGAIMGTRLSARRRILCGGYMAVAWVAPYPAGSAPRDIPDMARACSFSQVISSRQGGATTKPQRPTSLTDWKIARQTKLFPWRCVAAATSCSLISAGRISSARIWQHLLHKESVFLSEPVTAGEGRRVKVSWFVTVTVGQRQMEQKNLKVLSQLCKCSCVNSRHQHRLTYRYYESSHPLSD